jgi:hypothetical protein
MAKQMDTVSKREIYKIILPGSYRKTKNENKFYTNFHDHGHRSWKNKGIFTQIQNNRYADMSLRHRRPDYRSPTVRVRNSKEREELLETIILKDKRLANQ